MLCLTHHCIFYIRVKLFGSANIKNYDILLFGSVSGELYLNYLHLYYHFEKIFHSLPSAQFLPLHTKYCMQQTSPHLTLAQAQMYERSHGLAITGASKSVVLGSIVGQDTGFPTFCSITHWNLSRQKLQ